MHASTFNNEPCSPFKGRTWILFNFSVHHFVTANYSILFYFIFTLRVAFFYTSLNFNPATTFQWPSNPEKEVSSELCSFGLYISSSLHPIKCPKSSILAFFGLWNFEVKQNKHFLSKKLRLSSLLSFLTDFWNKTSHY